MRAGFAEKRRSGAEAEFVTEIVVCQCSCLYTQLHFVLIQKLVHGTLTQAVKVESARHAHKSKIMLRSQSGS